MNSLKTSFSVCVAGFLLAAAAGPCAAEGAKNLYYRQISDSKLQSNVGLCYSVELNRGGRVALVDSRYPFKSGDQLRFHVQSNIDGYLYILMKQGSRGDSALLFPAPGTDEDNHVKAGQDTIVPGKGVLEFDEVPGTESLKFVLSAKKLSNSPSSYGRSIMITPKHSAAAVASECVIDFNVPAAKAEFHDVEKPPAFAQEPAVTVVSKDPSKPLSIEMDLQHSGAGPSSPVKVAGSPSSGGRQTDTSAIKTPVVVVKKENWSPHVVADPRVVKDKWAVIIGISEFKNPQWNLLYPAKDAQDLGSFLVKEGNFAPDHVKILTNADATRENILTVLGSRWLPENVKPGDIVLVYFASHGTSAEQDIARKNFLVAYDTDPRNAFATGIEMQDLARTIKRRLNTDRIVIVLDTCHSGSAQPGAKALFTPQKFSYADLVQGTGQMVIASANENQIAHDSLRYKNGIFTKHFIDGLRKNKKLSDAFAYTCQKVDQESVSDFHQAQMPVLKSGQWKGADAVLAVPPASPRAVQN